MIASQSDLIEKLAIKSKFIRSDIKIILKELVGIFEELVREAEFEEGEDTSVLLKSRGFGILYAQKLGERKGNKGQILPETERVIFKLSENIRRAGKHKIENNDTDGYADNLTEFE